MRICVFLDLDDTVFQTRHKCPEGATLHEAAFARDGAALGFMTDAQKALFDWLNQGATVIPTTARDLGAFRRVRLPFRDLAILDFGGVLVHENGTLDPVWDAFVRPLAAAHASELHQIRDELQAIGDRDGLGIRARVIGDFGMDLYVVVKHPQGDLTALKALLAQHLFDHERYAVHVNGNNISVLPRFLDKRHAVRHVIEHHLAPQGPYLTVGVGDSISDAPYLGRCDYALLPQGSQIHREALGRWCG